MYTEIVAVIWKRDFADRNKARLYNDNIKKEFEYNGDMMNWLESNGYKSVNGVSNNLYGKEVTAFELLTDLMVSGRLYTQGLGVSKPAQSIKDNSGKFIICTEKEN